MRDINLFYRSLREKKLAASTIRQIHNVLAGSLDQAVRWGWRSDKPARWATLPPAHQAEVRPPAPRRSWRPSRVAGGGGGREPAG